MSKIKPGQIYRFEQNWEGGVTFFFHLLVVGKTKSRYLIRVIDSTNPATPIGYEYMTRTCNFEDVGGTLDKNAMLKHLVEKL